MKPAGRPLRFIATVLGGWVVMRAALLWPDLPDPEALNKLRIAKAPPPMAGTQRTFGDAERIAVAPIAKPIITTRRLAAFDVATLAPREAPERPPGGAARTLLAMFALVRFGPAQSVPIEVAQPPVFAPIRPDPPQGSRWSASLWFLTRGGQGLGGPNGGQLGGDQAGMRVAYAIGDARRVAIVGRIATPLAGLGREGAIGVEWRPTKLPVRLVAEHRFAIDGGGGGPSVGIVGGVGPAPIGGGLRIEGYGQAGIIERRGIIGYGDGAVRVTRAVGVARGIDLDVGAGAWGGIQPGAERLDVGPSLGLRLPVAGKSLRLAIDWRERIGGVARPGSGIALSIGTDF